MRSTTAASCWQGSSGNRRSSDWRLGIGRGRFGGGRFRTAAKWSDRIIRHSRGSRYCPGRGWRPGAAVGDLGPRLATWGRDGTAMIWDLASPAAPERELLSPHDRFDRPRRQRILAQFFGQWSHQRADQLRTAEVGRAITLILDTESLTAAAHHCGRGARPSPAGSHRRTPSAES